MAIGKVTIVKTDGMQGSFAEAERVFLYMGKIGDPDLAGEVIAIEIGRASCRERV